MKKLFPILLVTLLMCASQGRAGDIITATVVISSTSATNLNGTNAASITIGSDTRIATNNVVSASTQFYASTNAINAAFYLLNQLRQNPFTTNTIAGTSSTNNGVVLVGQEGVTWSIVISNSWATVAYRTNSVGTARVVRVPPTIESATTRTNVGNGIVAYLNQAHTTDTIDATAAAMANFASLADIDTSSELRGILTDESGTGAALFANGDIGAATGTSLALSTYFQLGHSALAVDNAGTNFVADFTGVAYRTITATNSVNLLQSTNRAAVRSLVLFVDANGTNRNFTVNSSWKKLNTFNSVITNGTVGVVSLTVVGTAETNVYASFAVTQ
jgi:hypothetical protein